MKWWEIALGISGILGIVNWIIVIYANIIKWKREKIEHIRFKNWKKRFDERFNKHTQQQPNNRDGFKRYICFIKLLWRGNKGD